MPKSTVQDACQLSYTTEKHTWEQCLRAVILLTTAWQLLCIRHTNSLLHVDRKLGDRVYSFAVVHSFNLLQLLNSYRLYHKKATECCVSCLLVGLTLISGNRQWNCMAWQTTLFVSDVEKYNLMMMEEKVTGPNCHWYITPILFTNASSNI